MKIKAALKNGRARFRLNDPHGPGGKRQRRFLRTRQEAEACLRQRKETVRSFGVHFATLTPAQQAELATQLNRLQRLGWTLRRAVNSNEARRLEWANILPDHAELPGVKAKTRRGRLIPITPQLGAWLDAGRAAGGQLPVRNFPTEFNRVRRLAGVLDG